MKKATSGFFRVVNTDVLSASEWAVSNSSSPAVAPILPMNIIKIDEDQHLVFGWFSVIEEGGEVVVDKHGDVIIEATLEKAVYDFVLNARMAGDSHGRMGVGTLVESIVFTKEKQKSLGIDLGRVGWYGGFKITDGEVWNKIKMGEYPSFSIGGKAHRVDYEETR